MQLEPQLHKTAHYFVALIPMIVIYAVKQNPSLLLVKVKCQKVQKGEMERGGSSFSLTNAQ